MSAVTTPLSNRTLWRRTQEPGDETHSPQALGQHFLADGGIIDAIVTAVRRSQDNPWWEIGPGLAALTQPWSSAWGA